MKIDFKLVLPCVALGLATFIMQSSESVISVCFNSSLLKYGGDIAVGVFNFTDSKRSVEVNLDSLGLPKISGKTLKLTELWTGEEINAQGGLLFLGKAFEPHSCKLYRARVVDAE